MTGQPRGEWAEVLRAVAGDPALVGAGHKAVEDVLVNFRDRRISVPFHGNGLVCRERDGKDSSMIRLGTADGIRVALKAIAARLEEAGSGGG